MPKKPSTIIIGCPRQCLYYFKMNSEKLQKQFTWLHNFKESVTMQYYLKMTRIILYLPYTIYIAISTNTLAITDD